VYVFLLRGMFLQDLRRRYDPMPHVRKVNVSNMSPIEEALAEVESLSPKLSTCYITVEEKHDA
jgi:hypothetical protein